MVNRMFVIRFLVTEKDNKNIYYYEDFVKDLDKLINKYGLKLDKNQLYIDEYECKNCGHKHEQYE